MSQTVGFVFFFFFSTAVTPGVRLALTRLPGVRLNYLNICKHNLTSISSGYNYPFLYDKRFCFQTYIVLITALLSPYKGIVAATNGKTSKANEPRLLFKSIRERFFFGFYWSDKRQRCVLLTNIRKKNIKSVVGIGPNENFEKSL